jgi:hypothetical protein
MFVDDVMWQLREFKVANNGSNVVFRPTTVKENPLAELYSIGSSISGGDPNFPALRTNFQNRFINTYLSNLTRPEREGVTSEIDVINGFSLGNANEYNEFQSDSGDQETDQGFTPIDPVHEMPVRVADNQFKAQISSAVSQLGLTHEIVLNRAGAMTCGGCHEYSGGSVVYDNNGVQYLWPESLGFFQVAQGRLSPALEDRFLPKRAELLKAFLCDGIPPTPLPNYAWLVPVINMLLL